MARRLVARHRVTANDPYHWAQRCAAAGVVLLLHGLLAGLLLRATGTRLSHDAAEQRISLRWLSPPPPATPLPATPATARSSPEAPPRLSRPAIIRAEAISPVARGDTTPSTNATPSATTTLNLQLPAGAVSGGDGIDAETVKRKLIGRRSVHPAFMERPPRFRMRPQMSPEQVLQGIGQLLGMWPPGYKVDPCELARQDAQYFEGAVDAQDREQLKAAWMTISARCR